MNAIWCRTLDSTISRPRPPQARIRPREDLSYVYIMAKQYSPQEQRANWLEINEQLQTAISNLGERVEERNLYKLFGDDLSKFMMQPSNTKNRSTLSNCSITFSQDNGSKKKIFITRNSSIPPYFYTDPHAMDVVAAAEERKLKQTSSVPSALVETMYKEMFEEDVNAMVAKILSQTMRAAGPYAEIQMTQMVTERIANKLFAGSGTKHSDTLIADEAKKALTVDDGESTGKVLP